MAYLYHHSAAVWHVLVYCGGHGKKYISSVDHIRASASLSSERTYDADTSLNKLENLQIVAHQG